MIWVITSKDTRNHNDFGGTPNSLINALSKNGISACGLNLYPWWMGLIVKNVWRCYRILTFRTPRGFQYTRFACKFREIILRKNCNANDAIVSFNQIVPVVANKFIIYTDCSVSYLFENYFETFKVPLDIRRIAIQIEYESYSRAKSIYLKTQEAIKDLHQNYGIPMSKLFYLPVPPNNQITLTSKILKSRQDSLVEGINFVFIGKDAYRKGLDRALNVVRFLQTNGISCNLNIVGVSPISNEFDDLIGVCYRGFMEANSPEIVDILEKSHFGFLLSRSEAAGISVREFQAAGIIPIVSDIPSLLSGIEVRNYLVAENNIFNELFFKRVLEYLTSGNLPNALKEAFEDANKISDWSKVSKVLNSAF